MNNAVLVQEGRAVDYAIIFYMAQKLVKSFKQWDAYELGLIDEDGEILREPETAEEKDALTMLDKLILKLKTVVSEHVLRAVTAFILLSEENKHTKSKELSELSDKELMKYYDRQNKAKRIFEDFKQEMHDAGFSDEEFWSVLFEQKCKEI